jgi:hypothetical protein
MKILSVAAGAILFACNLLGFAQSEVVCGQTLNVPLQSRSVLAIESRSAGLDVIGTDQEVLRVSCNTDDGDAARHIHLQFSGTASGGRLTISGSYVKHGNLQVRIEVPRKTSLGVRMPAGEVKAEEIAGNKDIELYAGQISVSSNQVWNYRTVDVSVVVGAVNAPAYGANKGGFFRSLKRDAADGEYRLHAHIMAGEIDLRGRSPNATTD